ncbi:MAG: GntR family transcriptional regulator [Ferrovibrio sp.]|uniref:GntR family transcriptional regulator n=1 Tax=Ferrovibrio sp. TaxID=1917215 RepID=UPI0026176359|nr:GntR family transcriptional regulator [Ferrovibrio sp.]MCW0234043.1 GntR family transcriptional regulator [Ferrovibrio sp.]
MSQSLKTILSLRELILGGELKSGERLSELSIVDRLGVSRTPVRMALVRLEEEGLLEAIPSGGYAVRHFSEADIFDAIETRGTLEGLAARLAAERGPSPGQIGEIKGCLRKLDVLVQHEAGADTFSAYVELNERFHQLLIHMAGSRVVARQIERAVALPFASPSAFVEVQAVLPESRAILLVAQEQHRSVVEAIERREGARAEALMREHSRVAHRNLVMALGHQNARDLVPGMALIRQSA